MKKHRNMTFRFNQDIDNAYRLLFGVTSPVGCSVCGDDDLDNLGIHPHDYHEKEWRTLCDKCYGATKQSLDNGLQKQIGGSFV